MQDLREILKENPDILIIGTGNMGIMKVPNELPEQLQGENIEIYVERTKKAAEIFNSTDKTKKVIAAFHLTC